MTLYTKSVADQADHFADVFVHGNVGYGDVMTFKSLQLTPFCLEKFCVRKRDILMFSSVFSANLVGIR